MCSKNQSIEVALDVEKNNKLLINFVYSENYCDIVEFVIIYLTKIEERFVEVVKYDFSRKEKLHVHYFYPKHSRKVFLDAEPNIDFIMGVKDDFVSNWHKHLIRFNNKD